MLLNSATPVSRLRVAHDFTWVADRFQIAGDDFIERRTFRAGDLDEAVAWCGERRLSDCGSNVVRRDRLNKIGGSLTRFPSALESATPPRNSRNWVARTMV